jgi:hypothetical protein
VPFIQADTYMAGYIEAVRVLVAEHKVAEQVNGALG